MDDGEGNIFLLDTRFKTGGTDMDLLNKLRETKSFIEERVSIRPKIGIVLGTGLGNLADYVDTEFVLEYKDIPHFPVSTVESHKGELLFGSLEGKDVLVMEGRFHFYEGWSLEQITYPIRVMKLLGIEELIISNAAGGLNPLFKAGDIMIIDDHINLMGVNPLIGPNYDELGPRFPDMSEPYSRELIELAENAALDERIPVKKGVYIAVTGPNLETRAEYRFFRAIGADAVGMSTVPEVIVAVHSGIKVLGISVITDMCLPDALEPATLEKIIAIANDSAPKLLALVKAVIARM